MRSRFAAFAIGDAQYLWRTLHPDHEDRARGAVDKNDALRRWRGASRALKYMRLTILDARDARVLFLAAVFEKGRDRSFVELSTFAHDGAGWRYLAGEARDVQDASEAAGLTIDAWESGG